MAGRLSRSRAPGAAGLCFPPLRRWRWIFDAVTEALRIHGHVGTFIYVSHSGSGDWSCYGKRGLDAFSCATPSSSHHLPAGAEAGGGWKAEPRPAVQCRASQAEIGEGLPAAEGRRSACHSHGHLAALTSGCIWLGGASAGAGGNGGTGGWGKGGGGGPDEKIKDSRQQAGS